MNVKICAVTFVMLSHVLYLALEKRYNFSLDELNIVVNGNSHF
jgi:hypothetical protein